MSPTPDDHLDQARRNLDLKGGLLQEHIADAMQTAYDLLSQCNRAARYDLATFDSEIVQWRLIGYYLARITTFVGL